MKAIRIFENRFNFIPLAALSFSVVGTILVACHVLIAGVAVAAVGLACGIVTRVFEKRYGLCEILAYWAFVLGIVLMIVCVLGFAGYTVLDLVNSKDVG